MKKLLFVLALIFGLVWNAAAALPEKVYNVKSGKYVHTMSMLGFNVGKVETTFDDYGLKTYVATSMEAMGQKVEGYVTINGARKRVVSVLNGEKEQEISDVELGDYGDYVMLDNLSDEDLEKAGIQRLGEEEIMGRITRVFKMKTEMQAGVEAWAIVNMWNGIPMKVDMELKGKRMNVLKLVSLETDIPVDPKLFEFTETAN